LWYFLQPGIVAPAKYKELAQKLAQALPGGDSKVSAPSNLIGLPGSLHVKDANAPFLVHVVQEEATRYGHELLLAISALPELSSRAASKPTTARKPTSSSSDSDITAFVTSSTTDKRKRLNQAAIAKGGQVAAGLITPTEATNFLMDALKSDPDVAASVEDFGKAEQTIESGIDYALSQANAVIAEHQERYPIHPSVADIIRREEGTGKPQQRLHFQDEKIYVDRLFEGRLQFNVRTRQVVWAGKDTQSSDELKLLLRDEMFRWGYHVKEAHELATAFASQNEFDPWAEYLKGLELLPEGEVETALAEVKAMLRWPDDSLSSAYLCQFLVDLCRRPLNPGCVQRRVLVIFGEENIGKSALFGNIVKLGNFGVAGDSPFCIKGQPSSNEFTEMGRLAAAAVYCFDELDTMTRKADQAQLKEFISRPADTVKLFHKADMLHMKRRGIIAATGNHKNSLPPLETNTRWMPVDLTGRLDFEALNAGGWLLLQRLAMSLYTYGQTGAPIDSEEFNVFTLSTAQIQEQIERNPDYILPSGQEDTVADLIRIIQHVPNWYNADRKNHIGLTASQILSIFTGVRNPSIMQSKALGESLRGVRWSLKTKKHEGQASRYATKDGWTVTPATPKDMKLLRITVEAQG
jgi:hypothetical protein